MRLLSRWVGLLLLGCSDGIGPRPLQPCSDEQEVVIAVSDEETPLFTWEPACGFASLQIWDQNQTSGWTLFTGSRAAENPLRSGIRYGEAPPEAVEPGPASPLVSGQTYRVVLYRWQGASGAGSLLPYGETTFEH